MRGHRRRDELLHDEFEIFALADELFLAAVLEPHHRAAHAVLVHEGQDVLQILAVMQVEEFGGALGVVARQRMGGDVVDLLVADPDDAAVIERIEIVLAGAQHRANGLARIATGVGLLVLMGPSWWRIAAMMRTVAVARLGVARLTSYAWAPSSRALAYARLQTYTIHPWI